MNFRNWFALVRQRWWLVLATVVLAIGAASVGAYRTDPRYAATVTFFVTAPHHGAAEAYQGNLFLHQRVKSYEDLLTSDRLVKAVTERTAIGLSAEEVRARISARVHPDTVLIEASVVDQDQTRAMELTQAIATTFVELVQTLETPAGSTQTPVKVEVVSGPRLHPQPVSPRPARDVSLAAGVGLLIGVALALVRGMTDTTVRDGAALRAAADAPLLGEVPYDSAAKDAPLIVGDAAHTPRAEAIRKLRTNLRFVKVGEAVQSIAVTSATQAEGKSTLSCNLAIALAEAGWRVVLVDADLRRPHIADYLGIEGELGLTNVLIGEVDVADALQPWGDLPLAVLPSGSLPPNPNELLGSKAMFDLLDALRRRADVVVVDTAPLLSITDGAVVAAQCDGALLATRRGATSRTQVANAATALRAAGARLLGTVLTMAAMPKADAYHYEAYKIATAGPVRPRVAAKSGKSRKSARSGGPVAPTQGGGLERAPVATEPELSQSQR